MTPTDKMKEELESKRNAENNQPVGGPVTVVPVQRNLIFDIWLRVLNIFAIPSLADFIHVAQSSRFFRNIIYNKLIQSRMYSLATSNRRPPPGIESAGKQLYFFSNRIKNRIASGQLTLNGALAAIASDSCPVSTSDSACLFGTSSLELRSSVISLGFSPAEARFSWWSREHHNALNNNIAFEEIEGLTESQVQAILISKKITLCTLYLQESLYAGRELTREDVISAKLLESAHILALRKGMSFECVKKLSRLQLSARFVGFSETDAQQSWLSEEHVGLIRNRHFRIEEVRGLPVSHVKALVLGYKREQIESLDVVQLHMFLKGYTVKEITDPRVVLFITTGGKQFSRVLETLVQDGVTPLDIARLTHIQLLGLSKKKLGLTLEQIRHPRFCKTVISAMKAGYNFETVIDLQPWQHKLLKAGVSLKEVCEPKSGFTLKHTMAVVDGGADYDQIKSLNFAALEHYLAIPCCALPGKSPVVLHAYPSGLHYASSGSSRHYDSAREEAFTRFSSSHSSSSAEEYKRSPDASSQVSQEAMDQVLARQLAGLCLPARTLSDSMPS